MILPLELTRMPRGDPTLGSILGDGSATVRGLSCKTTRTSHSDPEGWRDEQPSIGDRFELAFEIEIGPEFWLPTRATLIQNDYDGVFVTIASVSCGAPGSSTQLNTNPHDVSYQSMDGVELYSMPKGPLAGSWDAALNMQRWLLCRVLALCKSHGADLGRRHPVGSLNEVETLEPQTLRLCRPSQCNYAPWGAAFARSTGYSKSLVTKHLDDLLNAPSPADALRLVYQRAEHLEPWQISGLIQRGMPTQWSARVFHVEDFDDGSSRETWRPEHGGLMHEAVSLYSKIKVAEPWRLLALADLVDPFEVDSRGRTARALVQEQIASLSEGPFNAQCNLDILRAAEAFFEALDIKAATSNPSLPRLRLPSPRL